jgi:hypothetical protein
MQIDTHTKVILTVIAIGVCLLVFDQKPLKDAQAANATLVGGNYMVATEKNARGDHIWHMVYDKIRYCWPPNPSC